MVKKRVANDSLDKCSFAYRLRARVLRFAEEIGNMGRRWSTYVPLGAGSEMDTRVLRRSSGVFCIRYLIVLVVWHCDSIKEKNP